VDEVLAVGDAEFQMKCLGKMKDVAGQGRTVLFVSHNMGTILSLCKQCKLLAEGELNTEGTPELCINNYLSKSIIEYDAFIKHIKSYEPCLLIDDISINNKIRNKIDLISGEHRLTIKIKGLLTEKVKFDMEVKILDMNGIPLAFYSPGHETGYTNYFSAGDFNIERSINLPYRINKGNYLIDILLADPNNKIYAKITDSIILSVHGDPTDTGRCIEYSGGAGFYRIIE